MTRRRDEVVERARRLPRRRGAAMVEGVVAIPFFLLMFVGAMFVGGFYKKRIDAASKARNEAWQRAAVQSCKGGSNCALAGLPIVAAADLGTLSTAPFAALCEADIGGVCYEQRTSHAVSGGPWSFNQEIWAKSYLPCNDEAIAGDAAYKAAVEFLWDAYQKQGVLPANAVPPTPFDFAALYAFGGL